MSLNQCQTCRFWQSDTAASGACRRYAPRPTVVASDKKPGLVWPGTKSHEWCGEHAPKETA